MELTTNLIVQDPDYKDRTYRIAPNKIEGFVDGAEALKQAIYKVLSTERYEYPIYRFSYGVAWNQLIGEEQPYVRAEMKRMIRESLLRDERITEVDGFSFEFVGDICHCTFQIQSIYGEINMETEVAI